MDLRLATESLTFGTKVEVATDLCRAVGDNGDADDYEVEANKQALTWACRAGVSRRECTTGSSCQRPNSIGTSRPA